MRIVASACLVLAILFMVGCGLTDQQKTDLGKISAIEQKVGGAAMKADLDKAMGRLDAIEKYLNDKTATGAKKTLAEFMAPPDTSHKTTTTTTKTTTTTTPAATPAKPGKKATPSKAPGTTGK